MPKRPPAGAPPAPPNKPPAGFPVSPAGGAPAGVVEGRENVGFAGVAALTAPASLPPKSEGEAAAGAALPAPKKPPVGAAEAVVAGVCPSVVLFCPKRPPPVFKVGVEAPLPNRPPAGAPVPEAGVVEAAGFAPKRLPPVAAGAVFPPKRPPVAGPDDVAPPNRPPPAGFEASELAAVPNENDGVPELAAPPKRLPPAGAVVVGVPACPPVEAGVPKEKDIVIAVGSSCFARASEND